MILRPTQVLAATPAARTFVSPTHPLPATQRNAGNSVTSTGHWACLRCLARAKEANIKTFSWPADCRAASTRHDGVLLARLRAGHIPLLKAYANQLDTTVDPKGPSCGEEPQTVEHWLQRCPNAVALRHQLFGVLSPPLSVLTTNPGSMLALAKKILL